MKRLQPQFDAMSKQFMSGMPPQMLADIQEATREIAASGVVGSSPKIGEPAPGFTLPDARGGDFDLSSRLATGPVVLAFYRGAW